MQEQNTVYSDLLIIADAAFGRLCWSHKIINQTIDFVNRNVDSFTVGCSTLVKVQLDSGRYHQDFGYSESIAKTEGLAYFKARTSSCTNALRRTLLAFGETRIKIIGNHAPSAVEIQEDSLKQKRVARQRELQNEWAKRRRLYQESDISTQNHSEVVEGNPADKKDSKGDLTEKST